MSNMYGRAAVRAAQMLQEGTSSDPEAAWKRAITLEKAVLARAFQGALLPAELELTGAH